MRALYITLLYISRLKLAKFRSPYTAEPLLASSAQTPKPMFSKSTGPTSIDDRSRRGARDRVRVRCLFESRSTKRVIDVELKLAVATMEAL